VSVGGSDRDDCIGSPESAAMQRPPCDLAYGGRAGVAVGSRGEGSRARMQALLVM